MSEDEGSRGSICASKRQDLFISRLVADIGEI